MKQWMLVLMAVLFTATQAAAQQTPAPQCVTPPPREIPQIVAFDKKGLRGDHLHIFGHTADVGKGDNSISSMAILEGIGNFLLVTILRHEDGRVRAGGVSACARSRPQG